MQTLDFSRSYYRFYIDLSGREAISLSHKPPTTTNRTRIMLESSCRLTDTRSGKVTNYYLSAPCKTERVGAEKNQLWIEPNADVIFLISDDGQFAIHKTWSIADPKIKRYPEHLGFQPERQIFRWEENFDDLKLDLAVRPCVALADHDAVAEGILSSEPLVSRITYRDGDYEVQIDQPVKTINLCERERVFQTDTGPILVPDLSRLKQDELPIGCFDLAYSAWREADWAEFVIKCPTKISDDLSVNHYSKVRHVGQTQNAILMLK